MTVSAYLKFNEVQEFAAYVNCRFELAEEHDFQFRKPTAHVAVSCTSEPDLHVEFAKQDFRVVRFYGVVTVRFSDHIVVLEEMFLVTDNYSRSDPIIGHKQLNEVLSKMKVLRDSIKVAIPGIVIMGGKWGYDTPVTLTPESHMMLTNASEAAPKALFSGEDMKKMAHDAIREYREYLEKYSTTPEDKAVQRVEEELGRGIDVIIQHLGNR